MCTKFVINNIDITYFTEDVSCHDVYVLCAFYYLPSTCLSDKYLLSLTTWNVDVQSYPRGGLCKATIPQ